jgi:RHS repeat-associated protein
MKKPPRSALTFGLTLVLAAALFFTATALSQDSTPSRGENGQSETLLPNGQILQIGGDDATGAPLTSASIQDPESRAVTQLASHLRYARSWHSATVLPDGTVGVIGGLGKRAKTISATEQFDRSTETFSVVTVTGLTPRSHHTTTLLTDGTVLVVGGISSHGKTLGSAQIWNPRTNRATSLSSSLNAPRSDHTATLQADGSVLIQGGVDAQGNNLESGEIYNPKLGQFSAASAEQPASVPESTSAPIAPPSLADSIPANGATGVAVGPLISMRFSTPLRVDTVNSDTVTLSGPDGSVAATVVPAEGGMLAFVNPESQLAPSTAYTVTVSGVVDADGVEMPTATFSFTTAGASTPASSPSATTSTGKSSKRKSNPKPKTPKTPTSPKPGGGSSPKGSLPPLLLAPKGVTALSGRVLTLDGKPLPGVTFEIGSQKTSTDHNGRFLLMPLSPGKQALWIEGATANHGGLTFGEFEVSVDIVAAQTTQLGYTVWMPVLDTAHAVKIPSPTTSEVVVGNPNLPGLELHLQPGTIIKDWYGHVVHSVTITPIPVDQPPFPLPLGVQVPIYFTIQPGGSYFENVNGQWTGAQLYYPNTYKAPAGTAYDFWNYNSAPTASGWYVYGQGKVAPDGSQIIPNAGVQIYGFTGAMVGAPSDAPSPNPPPPADPPGPVPPKPAPSTPDCPVSGGGDPVDCSTGLFFDSHMDLMLSDVVPIQFTRTYRTSDQVSRPFGIGATDSYEMFIVGNESPAYTYQYLILPDGARVYYQRISAGTSWADAVYENTTAPGAFFGSTIFWNGVGWTLKLRNGTQYTFPESSGQTHPALEALLSITDRNGNTVTVSRDSSGNITEITSPNGRWITVQHDTSNRITQLQDNIGRTVSYTYDSSGRLATLTDAKGGVSSYTYDSSNRMLTMKDPNGNTAFTNQYDTAGRVQQQTLADGTSTYQFAYTTDSNGNVTQTTITDPLGNIEQKNFQVFMDPGDGAGNYINYNGFITGDTRAVSTPVQEAITWTRDPNARTIQSATDALSRESTYTWDSLGNLLSVTRLAGTSQPATTSYTYDPTFSQITSVTDPLGHVWSITLDNYGNPASITDPLGNQTTRTYNSEGKPASVTDPAGDTTRFTYIFGDLSTITDPLGNATRRFTDGAGRVISSTDPQGHTKQFSYDPLDHVTQIIDPINGITAYGYDANENLLSLTDADHNSTSYTYDSRNRAIASTDPLGEAATYQYDADNNLTQYTDRRGKITNYQYDNLNRVKFAGSGYNGSGYESTIGYTWDLGNRATGLTDSIAGTITRTYDGLDDVTDEQTTQGEVGYLYDNARRRESMTVVGQPPVDYTWNNTNRLTGLTQGTAAVGIGYDSASRRTSLTLPNGVVAGYAYDSDSHVTGITYSKSGNQVGNLNYSYDSDGRVTGKTGSLASTGMPATVIGNTFNADNAMTGFNGTALSYDANGNLISDGTNSYTWDARNHLTAISGGTTASFVYDAYGRRVQKTVNGTSTQFLYDGWNPIQELQGGTPSANLLTGLGIDGRFQRTDSAGARDYLIDILGSTLALTDSSGTIQTSYTYEPFGNTTISGASSTNPYQFTGREDDGTGSYFYRARYYSPMWARFISQDPIGFAGKSPNLYSYVADSPTNLVDPSGNAWQCWVICHAATAGCLACIKSPYLCAGVDFWCDTVCGAIADPGPPTPPIPPPSPGPTPTPVPLPPPEPPVSPPPRDWP